MMDDRVPTHEWRKLVKTYKNMLSWKRIVVFEVCGEKKKCIKKKRWSRITATDVKDNPTNKEECWERVRDLLLVAKFITGDQPFQWIMLSCVASTHSHAAFAPGALALATLLFSAPQGLCTPGWEIIMVSQKLGLSPYRDKAVACASSTKFNRKEPSHSLACSWILLVGLLSRGD